MWKLLSDQSRNDRSAFLVAIVAIIWKPAFVRSLRSLKKSSAIVAIMWKPLSRDCVDRFDEKYTRMQYVAVVPGPLGIAIVAIIWKLVRVRIAQLFGSDRSDHMETSLYLAP